MVKGNVLSSINNREIREKIYTFRGKQVMLDMDLAELYKVETRVFNQSVNRNINRFPEHFRFQLTEEEYIILRSQFVTSSSAKSHGGRRYQPYVFTEQKTEKIFNYIASSGKGRLTSHDISRFNAQSSY